MKIRIGWKPKHRLLTKGIPIVMEYQLQMSENQFKQFLDSKMQRESEESSSFSPRKGFIGEFRGEYQREFVVKTINSVFRSGSWGNSVWLHGEIEPSGKKECVVKLNLYRTKMAKLAHRIVIVSLLLITLPISLHLMLSFQIDNLLIFTGAMIFFYLISLLILMDIMGGQMHYFDVHLLNELDNLKVPNNR